MRAISLWQPWASLWVVGRKGNETRHWHTIHRGPLVIHAAKKLCVDIEPELAAICVDAFGANWAKELPRGALIGSCELANCIPTHALTQLTDVERACGNYSPGRFAWVPQAMFKFCEPIPYKGRQGFFSVPAELVAPMLAGGAIATTPTPQGTLL